ncbi:MAG TPA: branched-chain amino acid ABC transporter substrate-binding protein [Acetobacteraceae bacterium]|nr:branched-chain amino acid ABC transporter substrate-binding protein [Acetobacteraceae bacterium]
MRLNGMRGVCGLAALAVAAVLAGGPFPAPAAEPIKVGVPGPLSGPYANAGIDIVNAAKLAADQINAKGGVLGRPLEIVAEDDACDPQTAVQAAQKMIDSGVVAVAGGYCSGAALPELSTLHRRNIPYILDASTNPRLTELGYKDVFRTIGRDDEQGPFAASFIANALHAKRAAVVNDNTTYAKGLADATVAALKKLGVDVVYNNAITPGQLDYSPVLTRIASLNPDVIYFTGYFAEGGLMVKEARELHLKPVFMGGDGNNDPTLLKTAGSAANGMFITCAPLPQFLSGAKTFVDDYTKQFGHGPGPYSAYEYDAIGVLASAIERAKATTPDAINAALAETKDYPGITGDITFNAKGDRAVAVYIVVTVKNDEFAPYMQLNAAGQWVSMQ